MVLPDGARQILREMAQESDCVLFGECHGQQEVPQLLAFLLDDWADLGYKGLALEIPALEREPLQRWANGESETVPSFFAQPYGCGRGSEQTLELLRRAVAGGWHLLCFDLNADQAHSTWQERDRGMAENLTAQWRQFCPDRKIMGFCGNLHSRLTPKLSQFADLWPSFAAGVQELNPQKTVRTVNTWLHGGSFYNCKEQFVHVDPIPEAEVREDETGEHSLVLHLPFATPVTFLASPREY